MEDLFILAVVAACVLMIIYFIYKYFEQSGDLAVWEWNLQNTDWKHLHSGEKPRHFSKPMKPMYFGKKENEEEPTPLNLNPIASCSICHTKLNAISKMTCIKCLGVFCNKHLKKHKCKKKKFPTYVMDSKKYKDGTVVYYPDRKVPLKDVNK